jgi:hypothetical protein
MNKTQQIKDIYNKTIEKIKELNKERNNIISSYIKELEIKKIHSIKSSMKSDNK